MKKNQIVAAVRQWLESFVIGLNLCPFARHELLNDRIRFSVSAASSLPHLLADLQLELELLSSDPAIETTLLIHPQVLQDFEDYNQFLALADLLIEQLGFEGVYQIASFHPDYQFEDSDIEDLGNFTNRSPFPMLHVIREESLQRAIADFKDVSQIPVRTIELMRKLGKERLMAISCQGDIELA